MFSESSDEIAIRVTHLGKYYQIYSAPRDRLKQFVIPNLQRLLGGRTGRQYYQQFWALKDVSFEVKKGETVGIIGRNGSGKSTLLQIICGTLSPTDGQVETNGRIAALLELGAGFNSEFNGRENVYLSSALLGLQKEEVDNRFDDIVAFADIGDFLEQPIKTYSSGMMMRLAFAVNTCFNPEILVIDEALGVGDIPFQAKCFKRLRQMIDCGTSVVLVSHDISTLRSICDRALWLKHGRTEMWGEAKAVAKHYERFCWEEQGVVLQPIEGEENVIENVADQSPDATDPQTGGGEHDSSVPSLLFEPNPVFEANRQRSRIGTEGVVVKNFLMLNKDGFIATTCEFDEILALHYLLEVREPVNSDFILGFRVRDLKGNFVYSANDTDSIQRIEAVPGDRFVVSTHVSIPLAHQDYVVLTGVFGFKDGSAFTNGVYDYSKSVIWDVIEDAAYLTVHQHKFLPLPGPVNTSFQLVVRRINPYGKNGLH